MKIFLDRKIIRKIISFLLLILLLGGVNLNGLSGLNKGGNFSMPANAIEKGLSKEKIKKKITELKRKEKVEINKLVNSQQNLEETQHTIKNCEGQLQKSQVSVVKLQTKLDYLGGEYSVLAKSAEERVREIYKGERMSLLHVILASKDISTFFDRLYYQGVLLKNYKDLMNNLREKSSEIKVSKNAVENEKRNIASSLEVMNKKKSELNSSIQTSQYLINKLRTDRKAYEQSERELENLSRNIERNIENMASSGIMSDSSFIRPIMGSISSFFGWRMHPIFRISKFHTGLDISGAYMSPVKASNSGKVIYSGWYGGYGKVVIIDHGTKQSGPNKGHKISTLYAHMASTSACVGQLVKKGQVVGYEGSTGYSTGPHLHFEVRIDGRPVNPLGFIN